MLNNKIRVLNQKSCEIGETEVRLVDIGPTLTAAFGPFASEIARICNDRDVVVVVYEPHSSMLEMCRALAGYRGTNCVCKLAHAVARRLSHHWHTIGDHAAAEWLIDDCKNRILLITEMATFCLTLDDNGVGIEPGTTDAEWRATLS